MSIFQKSREWVGQQVDDHRVVAGVAIVVAGNAGYDAARGVGGKVVDAGKRVFSRTAVETASDKISESASEGLTAIAGGASDEAAGLVVGLVSGGLL